MYQLLALKESEGDHRNFELEKNRLEEKGFLCYKKIGATHYFIFPPGTFTSVQPKVEEFRKMRTDAGTVYGDQWEESPMM